MTRPNDNCQTFFESIGVDPSTVSAAGVDEFGYYTFVFDEHGSKVYYAGEELLRKYHQWPNGIEDWDNFVVAATKDWEDRNLNVDVHNLIDPML